MAEAERVRAVEALRNGAEHGETESIRAWCSLALDAPAAVPVEEEK